MSLGLIGTALAGAMEGGGAGVQKAATMYGDYLSRSTLQNEAAKIQSQRDQILDGFQRERDARLAEQRKGEIEYADQLARAPVKRAEEKATGLIAQAQSNLNAPDSAQFGADLKAPLPAQEQARIRAGAYASEGEATAASNMRREALDLERVEKDDQRHTADRAERAREADATNAYRNAVLRIQQATEGRLAKGTSLDNDLKQIAVDNARRVEKLRKEFETATPERKDAIREEVQLLSGKDTDKFMPVPLKDDMGNVTGYKIFDTKNGVWVEQASANTPSARDIELLRGSPDKAALFDQKFGKGAAARVLESKPAAKAPVAPPSAATPTPAKASLGAGWIKSDRGGIYIDPPPRSPAAALKGRRFASREEAQQALDDLYQ